MLSLFIINPKCRNGDADYSEATETLRALGPVEQFKIGEDGDLQKRVDGVGSDLGRLVVAGGDGTLNSVLPLALETNVPLGVLPSGTANDFARSLELPDDPAKAAQLIAEGHTRSVDVGVVNGHYFLNAVGVGLGPELTKRMDREQKKRLGVLAYLENLVEAYGRRSRRFAVISIDGSEFRSPFLQITVANGRHYGGGMMVSDDVEMNDGLLHVLCVRPLTARELFLRGIRLRFGAIADDDKLIYRKGKEVTISTRRECDVTADGELVRRTPIECKCLPSSLRVYVPEAQAESADCWQQRARTA